MAFRDNVGPNPFGLKQIMNVTKKVGTESDCANRSNDVEAVQKLLNLFLPSTEIFRAGFGLTNGTGRFDALTGFYIFKFQRSMALTGRTVTIDGCVTRATAFGYGGNTMFTIVGLNASANTRNPAGYAAFMASFPVTPPGVD